MAAEALVFDLLQNTNRPYNVQVGDAAAGGRSSGPAGLPRRLRLRCCIQRTAAAPTFSPCLQGVADMLATKGVKKAGAEKALDSLAEQGRLVRSPLGCPPAWHAAVAPAGLPCLLQAPLPGAGVLLGAPASLPPSTHMPRPAPNHSLPAPCPRPPLAARCARSLGRPRSTLPARRGWRRSPPRRRRSARRASRSCRSGCRRRRRRWRR